MVTLPTHAQEAADLRSIDLAWIEATVLSPDWIPPGSGRTHSYKAIPEFGGRILHVIHRPGPRGVVGIIVYFDRSAKP